MMIIDQKGIRNLDEDQFGELCEAIGYEKLKNIFKDIENSKLNKSKIYKSIVKNSKGNKGLNKPALTRLLYAYVVRETPQDDLRDEVVSRFDAKFSKVLFDKGILDKNSPREQLLTDIENKRTDLHPYVRALFRIALGAQIPQEALDRDKNQKFEGSANPPKESGYQSKKAENSTSEYRLQTLQKKLDRTNETNSKLNTRNQTLSSENDNLKKQSDDLKGQNQNLQKQVNDLTTQIQRMQESLSTVTLNIPETVTEESVENIINKLKDALINGDYALIKKTAIGLYIHAHLREVK